MSTEELGADAIEVDGTVSSVLSHGNFKVKFANEHEVLTRLSGKMRKFKIKIVVGDYVTVKISKYDLGHGLILYRHKSRPKDSSL